MPRPTLVRLATFLATVVAAWGVLSLGSTDTDPELVVGAPAPREYRAERPASVIDVVETEGLRREAREGVEPIERVNEQIENTVNEQVSAVFDDVEALVVGDEVAIPEPGIDVGSTSTTVAADSSEETTTTAAPEPAVLIGTVFIDLDADGVFDLEAEDSGPDSGAAGIPIHI